MSKKPSVFTLQEEYGRRIRVIHLKPPRELNIRIDNPIDDALFGEYSVQSNQEWLDRSTGERFIARASNSGHEKLMWVQTGGMFYSLYGVYTERAHTPYGHSKVGEETCIGDFDTFGKLLSVLEGIGLIVRADHEKLLEMLDGMENLR